MITAKINENSVLHDSIGGVTQRKFVERALRPLLKILSIKPSA
jgi:hypothetical protein